MNKALPLVISKAQKLAHTDPELKSLLKETMSTLSKITDHSEKIKYVHNKIDDFISETTSDSSCKKECSHCCYHKINLSTQEGALLKETSKIVNIKRLDLQLNCEEISFENKACVLLEDNKCTNYENRPLICRLTHVNSSPVHCSLDNETTPIKHLSVSKAAITAAAYYLLYNDLILIPESFK